MEHTPSYIQLFKSGELSKRLQFLEERITDCVLCPHKCRVDRTTSYNGFCETGSLPLISSFHAHFGEEAPLVGSNGSGTIFFAGCNMRCIYCQNYEISHFRRGQEITYNALADMMIRLQEHGCHNINFVTPSHMIYQIVKALIPAIEKGLHIPLVYNTGGYDDVTVLQAVEGVFDVYMPDFKYFDADAGYELSGISDYPETAKRAITEMHRQVGNLKIQENGIAYQGVLIRHLVLPQNKAQTKSVLKFISQISKDSYINLMSQYHPEYHAYNCKPLQNQVSVEEFREMYKYAKELGFYRFAP